MADNEYNININNEDSYSVNIDNNDKNYSVEINPTNTYEIQLNEQGPQGNRGETGNGIVSYEKTSTDVLVDTYTITFTNGNTQTVRVSNGKGITSITGPVTDVLKDTYTIHYNDNTTSEYYVYNGKGIINITGPSTSGLTDTYTINYNDGSTSTFEVENGNGITSISKTSTEGLVDIYTINFSNGNDTTFTVTNGEKGDTGNGISNIELDTTSGGAGEDTTDYIVNYTDGDTDTISVYNSVIEDVTATITGGVGTPSVTVTDTINPDYPNRKSFAFEFENLKGDKGDTGSTGPTGNGISSVTYNDTLSSGLVDIYDINYTNGNTDTISVTNGNGILSIENDTISSDIDTTVYDINYTNGNSDTISVTNSVVSGATATVNNNVGTPDVNVTTTSDATHTNRKIFNFEFLNLKGNTGEQGTSITDVEYIGIDPNDNLKKIYRISFSDTITGGHDYFDYIVTDGQAGALPQIDSSLSLSSTNPVQNKVVTDAIYDITDLIPAQATTLNQLADKEFVNSSISTNTANFIGTFSNVPSLNAYSGTVTNNDYAFVVNSVITNNGNDWANTTDLNNYNKDLVTNFDYAWVINGSNFDLYRFDILNQTWSLRVQNTSKNSVTLNIAYNRYKATVSNNTTTWEWEYTLNNSSFTASQWATINSGITSGTAVTHTNNTAVGSTTQPVYVDTDGSVKQTTYQLNKTVPSDAVFTDTTYSTFTGADTITAGNAGLVPAPTTGDVSNYLCGDGTWRSVPSSPPEIYWVNQTSTTTQEIADALSAGKILFLTTSTNGNICQFVNEDNTAYYFASYYRDTYRNYMCQYFIYKSNGQWYNSNIAFENSANKVTSLSSSSTNTQYPSAKCVYDALQSAGSSITIDYSGV